MKVQVYLLESNREYDILYTYLAPGESETAVPLVRGTFVWVPFGPKNTPREAVVWETEENLPSQTGYCLKTILEVDSETPPLNEQEQDLCQRLQAYYLCTLGDAIRCVRPYRGKKNEIGKMMRICKLNQPETEIRNALEQGLIRNIGQIRILEILLEVQKPIPVANLIHEAGCSDSAIRTLEKKGIVTTFRERVDPDAAQDALPGTKLQMPVYAPHVLNEAQQTAFDCIEQAMVAGKPEVFLLHGVTGSGKTEVYMQLIDRVVSRGGNTIMLVPEISLTPQLLSLFAARFGNRIAVLHSRLTDVQRVREWRRIEQGDVQIVVGARSAVFAPFSEVDLVILDEFHDHSYQAEDAGMKYHAKDVATIRCKDHGVVVLGSATPDVSVYHRAQVGAVQYLPLPKRAMDRPLPTVSVVDMREEIRNAGCIPIFSGELLQRMRYNYQQGLQTLIFVGRRGYASGLLCRDCGRTMKCGKCNIPMTYHASGNRLICHYCGNTAQAPATCPACGSPYLEYKGIGTERVVQEIKRLFPEANVLRMDADTTLGKDGHGKILKEFSTGDVHFLVGTQMVTKGHDFPGVTLVGVLNTDGILNSPEYRGEERAFQLLTQVAGRAGRGKTAGHVVVQAYDVDNYAISAAQNHDYREFYQNEIVIRENLWYPPYCTVCSVQVTCENDRAGFLWCKKEVEHLRELIPGLSCGEAIEVWGPSRAPMPKVNGQYRWLMTIKASTREAAISLLKAWLPVKKLGAKMRLTYTFE